LKKKIENKKFMSKNYFWIGLIGIVIVSLAVLVGFLPDTTKTATLPLEVSVNEAYQMREEGAYILDVREVNEWEEAHIPGATLLPLGELESRLGEIPKDQDVVIVCRSGNRSAQARDLLMSAGFTNITSMAGGMNQWIANSFEFESGK